MSRIIINNQSDLTECNALIVGNKCLVGLIQERDILKLPIIEGIVISNDDKYEVYIKTLKSGTISINIYQALPF